MINSKKFRVFALKYCNAICFKQRFFFIQNNSIYRNLTYIFASLGLICSYDVYTSNGYIIIYPKMDALANNALNRVSFVNSCQSNNYITKFNAHLFNNFSYLLCVYTGHSWNSNTIYSFCKPLLLFYLKKNKLLVGSKFSRKFKICTFYNFK